MSHDPNRTIQMRAAGNVGPCTVARCTTRRHGASKHCRTHKERLKNYGHPEGQRLQRKTYETERRDVTKFLRRNKMHAGVRNALAFLSEWMQSAAEGDKDQPGYIHLARLQRHEVEPRAILEEAAAVWLYATRYPTSLPDDQRLTHALALGTLYLVPRDLRKTFHYRSGARRCYREATPSIRREVGEHLRRTLALLLLNVTETIEEQHRRKAAARATYSAPFTAAPQ